MFQQEIHHTHVVLFTSNVQRSESILLKNNNNETIIITARTKSTTLCVCVHVSVSVTDQRPGVGFGSFVQQHFGHAVVAAVCRHMQRGEVVQCDVINLRVVLQELFDAVHVVPLCCHVDWRQAILQKKQKKQGHVLDSLILCKNRKQLSEREAAARGEYCVCLCFEALCRNVFCASFNCVNHFFIGHV